MLGPGEWGCRKLLGQEGGQRISSAQFDEAVKVGPTAFPLCFRC